MTKAVAYARYSSDNQTDNSIAAQLRAIRDYAAKNGIFITREYIDEAKSATTDDRPDFLQMFTDIAKGLETDYLLIHKLDRFARNRYDSAMYRRKLTQNGIKLIAVDQPLGDSPEDKLLEGLLESMNEFYSLNLAREVMKGMKENALAGKHTGGKPPLGYDVDPSTKKLVINEHESKAVKMIFEMYIAGKTYSAIINRINSLFYKTKENRPFSNTSLHSILTNEKYTGTYIFNRSAPAINGKRNNHSSKSDDLIIRIPDSLPVIITKEDFAMVKKIMERRKKQTGANQAKETYLLTGLIKCGKCGAPMIGNRKSAGRNKTIYHSYDCNNRKRFKTCDAKSVNKEYVEKMVIDNLMSKVFSDRGIVTLTNQLNKIREEKFKQQADEFNTLKKELEEIENQIKNAVKAIMAGLDLVALRDELSEAEKKKVILTQTLKSIVKSELAPITKDFVKSKVSKDKKTISEGTLEEIKNVVQSYVTEVLVNPDNIDTTLVCDFDGGGGAHTFKSKLDYRILRNQSRPSEYKKTLVI